jgi:hypothetical protein
MVGVWKALILLFILFSQWAPNDLDGRIWKSYSRGLYIIYYIYNIYNIYYIKQQKIKTKIKQHTNKTKHISNCIHYTLACRDARTHHHSPMDLEHGRERRTREGGRGAREEARAQ